MTIAAVPTADEGLQGFQYAQKKRKPSRKARAAAKIAASTAADGKGDLDALDRKFEALRLSLRRSPFYKDFQKLVLDLVEGEEMPRIKRMKMLGIGTLTHTPSLYQLALGLDMAKALDVPLETISTSDPMYTSLDKALLSKLGLNVVSVEEGTRSIDAKVLEVCLVYAPHVPKSVYETILRAHWDATRYRYIVLLGNDLSHYPEFYAIKRLEQESPCILAAGSLLQQASLPSNFEHNNVFNDMAFQWLKRDCTLPKIAFEEHVIEKEHFEINQDKID